MWSNSSSSSSTLSSSPTTSETFGFLGPLANSLVLCRCKIYSKKRLSDPSCFSNSVDVLFSFISFRNLPFHFKLDSVNTIVIIREGDYPKYDMMGRGRGGLDSGYSLKMMMSFMNSP